MYENVHEDDKMKKLQILVDRLMNGEITKEEYEALIEALN